MATNATSQGTTPEVSFISRSTLEKRVRRALATKGHRLLKSRPGTAAFREYGRYSVENGLRRIVTINHDLSLLAHELGVIGDHERLQPKYDKISVATSRYEDEAVDRIEHFVVGTPGSQKTVRGRTVRMAYDLLAGPFTELADAEEARDLMQGGCSHE